VIAGSVGGAQTTLSLQELKPGLTTLFGAAPTNQHAEFVALAPLEPRPSAPVAGSLQSVELRSCELYALYQFERCGKRDWRALWAKGVRFPEQLNESQQFKHSLSEFTHAPEPFSPQPLRAQ
jgi:hypothetical protein